MRRLAVLVAIAASALAAGCGAGTGAGPRESGSQAARITELGSIQQLRSVFEAHDGTPRLLILASPT
jgi:hypothetical protein